MKCASEIVKRALELADMSGSHVISYKEESDYLAQAWKYVNQKCVQQGVKYFYGRCPVMSGVNRLPWDFDQIDTIKTRAGYQLPRHTNDMDENFGSFDKVVEVMGETGHDLPDLYRETAEGGLAKRYHR